MMLYNGSMMFQRFKNGGTGVSIQARKGGLGIHIGVSVERRHRRNLFGAIIHPWVWTLSISVSPNQTIVIAEGDCNERSFIYIFHLLREIRLSAQDYRHLISPLLNFTVERKGFVLGHNAACRVCGRITRKHFAVCSKICARHYIAGRRAR